MTTKVHVKFGSVEVLYEGAGDFTKADLLDILRVAAETGIASDEIDASRAIGERKAGKKQNQSDGPISKSMTAIAQKLAIKTGPALVIGACAYLQIVQGKEHYTRTQITTAMREAKTYYKKSYASNLTKILTQLTKDNTITELSADAYCLMEPKLSELQTSLA